MIQLPVDFDEKEHIYSLAGRRQGSVTGVLQDQGLYPYYPDAMIYRSRGKAVHRGSELLALKTLNVERAGGDFLFPGTDERLWGYLTGFCRFLDQYGTPEIILSEQVLYDPLLVLAGTLDYLMLIQNIGYCIIDLKTGAAPRCVAIQLAGYEMLLRSVLRMHKDKFPALAPGIELKRYSLQLKPEGTFVFERHAGPSDGAIFQSAVNCYNWKRDNGLVRAKAA